MKYASVSSNHTLRWEAAGAKGTSSISAVKSRLWWRTESEAVNLKNSAAPGTNHNEAKLLQSSSAEETDRDTQIEGGRKYRRHMRDTTHVYEDKKNMGTNLTNVCSFCSEYILELTSSHSCQTSLQPYCTLSGFISNVYLYFKHFRSSVVFLLHQCDEESIAFNTLAKEKRLQHLQSFNPYP